MVWNGTTYCVSVLMFPTFDTTGCQSARDINHLTKPS